MRGSSVTVYPVDGKGNPTGQSFPTETNDDLGHFTVTVPEPGPVLLSANGYFFNELLEILSGSQLTLNAYATITPQAPTAYINIFTQLTHDRVQVLLTKGIALPEAVAQAENELQKAIRIGGAGFDAGASGTQMNLLGADTDANAYLEALSGVFLMAVRDKVWDNPGSSSTDPTLQQLIDDVAQSLASSGTVDANTVAALLLAQTYVEPDWLMASLSSYLADGRVNVAPPDVNRALDSDLDGIPNALDNCPLVANPDQSSVASLCNYRKMAAVSVGPYCNGVGMEAGDFNGDGYLDVVTVCRDPNPNPILSSIVQFFAGDGKGNLVPGPSKTLGGLQLSVAARASDIDSDGALDLLLDDGALQWMRGDGTGDFGAPTLLPQPPPPICATSVAIADVTGDGLSDLVYVAGSAIAAAAGQCNAAVPLEYYPGIGDGGFGPPAVLAGLDAGVTAPLLVVDLNHDGRPDLICGSEQENLLVFLGAGDGGFALMPALPLAVLGQETLVSLANFVTGDVDADGNLDLLVTAGSTGTLLFGDGRGTFGNPIDVPSGPAEYATAAFLADITGDGKADVVSVPLGSTESPYTQTQTFSFFWPYAQVRASQGRSLAAPVDVMLGGAAYINAGGAAVGDLNGDGHSDLLTLMQIESGAATSFVVLPTLLNVPGNHSW